MITFYTWLKSKKEDDNIVGDFAIDVLRDKNAPIKSSKYETWKEHLDNNIYCKKEALIAFEQAFKEYKKQNK